jgi:hypothetical protein
MIKFFKIVILIILFFSRLACMTQTIYGVTGLIKIPDASIIDTGKCMLGGNYFKEYVKSDNKLIQASAWSVTVNIGFHSRFEIGGRVAGFPELITNDPNKINDYYNDRCINFKFIILKEKKFLPQIAIGSQDLIGTRKYNTTYLVCSKSIKSLKMLNFNFIAGYGSDISTFLYENSEWNVKFLNGFFGGISTTISEYGIINLEYDSRDINLGVTLKYKKYVGLNLFLTGMKYPGGGFWVRFGL